jgi:dihydrofolate reductase
MNDPAIIRPWRAVAAMSLNRVIGFEGRIPWHHPEDFRFFRRLTTGHILVMGRKTFASIGRALPERHTLVLSRSPESARRECAAISASNDKPAGTWEVIGSIDHIPVPAPGERQVFICGGAEIYRELLGRCAELFLTRVKREVHGDAFFPPFEERFSRAEILQENDDLAIERWARKEGEDGARGRT